MNDHTNIVRIKAVNKALANLGQEFVFVGGAVVSLYADRSAEEVRPTDDVDVLVEIYSRFDYSRLEERLRELGFKNDTTSGFVGRYITENLIVDFMPLEEKVLGFNNRWYTEGFKKAVSITLDESNTIRILQPLIFLQPNWKLLKAGEEISTVNMTDVLALILKILFICWLTGWLFGMKWSNQQMT